LFSIGSDVAIFQGGEDVGVNGDIAAGSCAGGVGGDKAFATQH
jgi:hypothetical protein